MNVLNFLLPFLFMIFLGIVVDSIATKSYRSIATKASKVFKRTTGIFSFKTSRVSKKTTKVCKDANENVFHNLAKQVLGDIDDISGSLQENSIKDPIGQTPTEEKLGAYTSAGRIMFALALANGYVTAEQANHFSTILATATSEEMIASNLADYFPEKVKELLKRKYFGYHALGNNAVEAMTKAMEQSQHIQYIISSLEDIAEFEVNAVRPKVKPKSKFQSMSKLPSKLKSMSKLPSKLKSMSKLPSKKEKRNHLSSIPPKNRKKFNFNVGSLGCVFEDKEFGCPKKVYDKESNSERYLSIPLDPLGLEDWDDLSEFIEELTKTCRMMLQHTTINDVDQLIRFVAEYKGQSKSFPHFYENFKYKYRPLEETAKFEMKILKVLQLRYITMGDYFHLVSVYTDNPWTFTDWNAIPRNADAISRNHIADFLKPDGEGFEENKKLRNLYIDWVTDDEGDRFLRINKYDLHGPDNKKTVQSFLYFLETPYCPFLEKTFKPKLLLPDHGMIRFHDTGMPRTVLNFRIGKEHHFNIVTYDEHGNETAKTTILFRDVTDNMTEEQKTTLARAAKDLEMTPKLLWGKMVAIKWLIFDDADTINSLEYNMKLLRNKDEIRTEQDHLELVSFLLTRKPHITKIPKYFLEGPIEKPEPTTPVKSEPEKV